MKRLNKSNLIGSWLQIGNNDFTMMMARSGFQFLVTDMEHGSVSEEKLPQLFNIIKSCDCVPFVRVAKNSNILIRRAIDLGAKGIIVPNVNSLEDVIKAEKAIYYPPKGERGVGFSVANSYGLDFNNYFEASNDDIIFTVQIESVEAVKNIDKIFNSNNIDYYIIGPYDLTGSMGIVGQFDHPDYSSNLKKIQKSAINHGVKSGIHVVNPNIDELQDAIEKNYDFIAYSTDALLMYDKCKKDLEKINKKK